MLTTRWNIASYLYLLNYGRYDQAGSEANIDYAARLGFNAVRFNIWWQEIFPDATAVNAGGNWSGLDYNIDYAAGKGLKVILTVCLRKSPQDDSIFTRGDCVVDSQGETDSNWDKTTRMSFSSPRFGRAIRFFQQVGERYRERQNAGHILAIAPLVTREAEIPYAHEKVEDFNPAFVAEFRTWLAGRYGQQIAALNAAWGSHHTTFDKIAPPQRFNGAAGHDWYRFRDLKARQFVDSCCAALAAIPGVTTPYRVLLDYGNVGDPMAWRRGSLSFTFHAANPMVWGVKHNDAHDYNHRYSGSLLGSNMRRIKKVAFNEWFYDKDPKRYPGNDVVGDSYREIKAHYDQGMNGVSYVGVYPPNKDLEAIVQLLKKNEVWDSAVTPRRTDPGSAIHVKFSTLLDLNGWEIRERYFDPHARPDRPQVDMLIDYDFQDPVFPIIPPQDYGNRPNGTKTPDAKGALPTLAPAANPLFWCESTDPSKLKLHVVEKGGRYFLSNVAGYQPPEKNVFYFVDWDFIGDSKQHKPLQDIEVEPNRLYLIHLYELSKPRRLTDFWCEDDPRKACDAAFLWVGGKGVRQTVREGTDTTGVLREIREDPGQFRFRADDRLPVFTDLLPPFQLPTNKIFILGRYAQGLTFSNMFRHGVTHIAGVGPDFDPLPTTRRAVTMGSFLNEGIGSKPNPNEKNDHISPTEKAFMECSFAHVTNRAAAASFAEYFFLDEEFWHDDYQPATIERLCVFFQEMRRRNPLCKPSDFWSGAPPYRKWQPAEGQKWSALFPVLAGHYSDPAQAMAVAHRAFTRRVTLNGQETSLAEIVGAVCVTTYFDQLFGYDDELGQFRFDYTFPSWIHYTRVNRRLPCNRGKPEIWFGMGILEGNYRHPSIAFQTRTLNPPGLVTWKERLPVAPNVTEQLALFGLLEGDGAYLWDSFFTTAPDPDAMFWQVKYSRDYKDPRGQWQPDVPGTPPGRSSTPGTHCIGYSPVYYALAAWKYSQIADILDGGTRLDFEYSLDDGKTWYTPPANGSTMCDAARDRRPIVTGAVKGRQIAVVTFDPYQGVGDTTPILLRWGKDRFRIDLFGKRVRVYRGELNP